MLTKVLIGVLAAGALGVAGAPAAVAEQEVGWLFTPEVQPGGEVHADNKAAAGGCVPKTSITSPGLVAPMDWRAEGMWGGHRATGTAVKKPGKYTATFTCNDGRKGSATFTVLGTPDPEPPTTTPTPTSTKPKPTPTKKPAKPQVAVKPVGAPQTGGGGTANR